MSRPAKIERQQKQYKKTEMQKTVGKNKNTDYPLDIWQKIEIVVEEKGESGTYVARIDDFNTGGIVITKPEWIGGGKFLVSNARVFVRFVKSDAMYQFPAHTRRLKDKMADKLLLYNIGSIRRLQRREFVRIDYLTKLTYTVISDLKNKNREFKWFPSQTSNISAGGVLMKVGNQIKIGDLLLLKIDNYSTMKIPRFIVACCRRLVSKGESLMAGVEFVIAEKLNKYFESEELEKLPIPVKKFDIQNQNKLVRFIFEEQIEERNKGLI